jgi:hypothetical protein
MTHDELIAKINHRKITNQHLVKDLTIQQAKALIAPLIVLRAVVELHKPNPEGDECSYCGWECGGELVSFPCDTIKTIEKELG